MTTASDIPNLTSEGFAEQKSSRGRRLCVVGQHELDYPRNRVNQALFRQLGWEVVTCHSRIPFPFRHLSLMAQYLRRGRGCDLLYITEGGHRFVPEFRLLSRLFGQKVLFDPFLSRYNTRVEDRKLHKPGSLQARICSWQDWSGTHAADYLLFDTEEHQHYFFARYGLDKPWFVLPVMVDEAVFAPAAPHGAVGSGAVQSSVCADATTNTRVTTNTCANTTAQDFADPVVLFYGTFIPLQGVETILQAAQLLQPRSPIRFRLIGAGQLRPEMERLAQELGLTRTQLVGPVPEAALVAELRAATVALGIFGTGEKSARVVPNKLVQGAAMGVSLVTRRSPAVERHFVEGESALLVEPGDPAALAAALERLCGDASLRQRIGAGARRVFLRDFAAEGVGARLERWLRTLGY